MVEKATGASCTSSYTEIVYAPSGARLATMTGQTLQQASVPLIGGAEAVYNSSGLLAYRHSDHLGSSRFASTPSRTKYFDVAYAPYGEDYADSGTTDLSFTGQKKDTASWLYDFMFRKYNAAHGRWMSPDPAGMGAANPGAPQTWNRYAYVSNSPMNAVDPLGLLDPPTCKINDISCGGLDNGGQGFWPGAGGYSGAINGGAGVEACGVDPFCIGAGGIGPFGSPVANGGSWSNSMISGGHIWQYNPPTSSTVPNGDFWTILYGTGFWSDLGAVSGSVNSGAANTDSWLWTATKSFFRDFSVLGPKNDPRPSCFGQFLADAGSGFVNSFALPSPSPGEIIGVGTAMADYSNEVGIVAAQHLAKYGSRISKYTIGEQAGARAGLAGLLANADYQGVVALVNEYGSASSGQCK